MQQELNHIQERRKSGKSVSATNARLLDWIRVVPQLVGKFIASLPTVSDSEANERDAAAAVGYETPNPRQFSGVWLDYTGCWVRKHPLADTSVPRDDVLLLLRKRLLRTPSILAITVTLRCGLGVTDAERMWRDIQHASSYYCLDRLRQTRYGAMLLLVLYVQRAGQCGSATTEAPVPAFAATIP
jgi:hypothetical protein